MAGGKEIQQLTERACLTTSGLCLANTQHDPVFRIGILLALVSRNLDQLEVEFREEGTLSRTGGYRKRVCVWILSGRKRSDFGGLLVAFLVFTFETESSLCLYVTQNSVMTGMLLPN